MVQSPGISPPLMERTDRFSNEQSKMTALTIASHARKSLAERKQFNDASVRVLMKPFAGDLTLRREIIDHVEDQLFEVPRRLLGGFAHFVLRWNEGDDRFAIIRAFPD